MSVVVLIYHKTPAEPDGESFSVTLDVFRAQIEALERAGHPFVPFEATFEAIGNAGPAPVCVTFDDGHGSNIEALEFLRERGIRPTVFVVRRWSEGDPQFLSREQIAALAEDVDFGSHGVSHTAMTHLSDAELAGELTDSRTYLEGILARPIRTMAFPGGRFDARTVLAAQRAGYTHIGTSVALDVRRRGQTINRFTVHADRSAASLASVVGSGAGYWTLQRARRTATTLAGKVLPAPVFAAAARASRAFRPVAG